MTHRGPSRSTAHHAGARLRAAVLSRLERDALSATQLAERLGVSDRTLSTLCGHLAAEGLIACVGRDGFGKYWRATAVEVTT